MSELAGKNLLSGNQAIVKGALQVGASYFAGYPITPASSIMNHWVDGIKTYPENVFLQTEDEIAAIHSVIGASLAGKKSFTATSGPGFSLMQEGLGLAYAYKTPLVVVNVQRQGPSTGMPTLFSQDCLLQTQYGSHGDYGTIVLYPNSVEECYFLTIKAFNLACQSSSPVILLSDAYLAQMYENVELEYSGKIIDFPFEGVGNSNRHFTGLTNVDGVVDTKNASAYHKWQEDLQKGIVEATKNSELFEYTPNEKADTLIISFGILSRAVAGLVEGSADEFALFRPIQLFPIVEKLEKIAKDYDRIVVVEGNMGQYQMALQSFLCREVELISSVGGEIELQKFSSHF